MAKGTTLLEFFGDINNLNTCWYHNAQLGDIFKLVSKLSSSVSSTYQERTKLKNALGVKFSTSKNILVSEDDLELSSTALKWLGLCTADGRLREDEQEEVLKEEGVVLKNETETEDSSSTYLTELLRSIMAEKPQEQVPVRTVQDPGIEDVLQVPATREENEKEEISQVELDSPKPKRFKTNVELRDFKF